MYFADLAISHIMRTIQKTTKQQRNGENDNEQFTDTFSL